MKGIVFSEFIDMVDKMFSIEMSERLIDEADLPSGAAYTTVGTYSPEEMVALVAKLSELTAIPVSDLLKTFGRHLVARFAEIFPAFFRGSNSTFDFLPKVESFVHIEVNKLYPDAELPSFAFARKSDDVLEMIYSSPRNMPDLAEGLVLGAGEYFNERLSVERRALNENPPAELFIITRIRD